ncbi:hypothetical protein B0H67DRAFT_500093 [Lasiosphaeris hirsuta]|uniref:Uncharacterized protein n=1 Tax=Lasiosphaeris hirsuta TaxID=260670 RepID=A0AA40DK11_9PEZI|nr:hypothetical protein B0H67DRAFT_500093 [Lasiosphaeris hirsuta]
MASACSIPKREVEESIRETGVYSLEDLQVGAEIAKFSEMGLPTKTPYGLEFCAKNSLDNQDIRKIIESILDRPRWGCIKIYSDKLPSDQALFFHNPSSYLEEPAAPALLVRLCSPGSRIVYYKGSHIQNISPIELEGWGLLALPRVEMKKEGIIEKEVPMKNGGFRLGFTVLEGFCVNVGFASESEVRFWAKMELPDTEAVKAKADELKLRGFNINISFVGEKARAASME